MLQFQALSSRRFRHGFDRVNLHRPTVFGEPQLPDLVAPPALMVMVTERPIVQRRKLNLKAKWKQN